MGAERSAPDTLNHMVEDVASALDDVFAALADPTRRAIVAHLASGEASVSELAKPFDVSLAAVSKHVHVLRQAGLLSQRQEGRQRLCRLVAAPLRDADDWLADYRRFWDLRLDALAGHFEQRGSSGG
jgi:DNA-binding transcriptional ArsR family regulator